MINRQLFSALFYVRIKYWSAGFKRDQISLKDKALSGKLVEVTNDTFIGALRQFVVEEMRTKINVINGQLINHFRGKCFLK